jgi:RNA-directed DNA polymerase
MVRKLQQLLTRSFSTKAIAVKRVTENKGKRTAGVDGETWNTPVAKHSRNLKVSKLDRETGL